MHKVEASTEEEAIDAPVACEVPHPQFSQIVHVVFIDIDHDNTS